MVIKIHRDGLKLEVDYEMHKLNKIQGLIQPIERGLCVCLWSISFVFKA